MHSPSGRADRLRPGKPYRGSRKRIRHIARVEATPVGVFILLLLTLFIVLLIFYWFDHAWPVAGDEMAVNWIGTWLP